MASLKLVSLNIERDNHFDTVLPFLVQEAADVVCLQEVREPDIPRFTEALGGSAFFSPTRRSRYDDFQDLEGECIVTRLPIQNSDTTYYIGSKDDIPRQELPAKRGNHAVTRVWVEKEGAQFQIATTHFVWTPKGDADDMQRSGVQALLGSLQGIGGFVLAGDFNAPRGGEIFSCIAEKYRDNIPPHYVTSIDIALHRAGKERPYELVDKMVDGLFTTPEYEATDVRLVSGVSDHMAIVATITRLM